MKGLFTTTNNLKKLVWQALMSRSTRSRRTGEVDAAVEVRAHEVKRVKEEIKGGNRKKERKKKKRMGNTGALQTIIFS